MSIEFDVGSKVVVKSHPMYTLERETLLIGHTGKVVYVDDNRRLVEFDCNWNNQLHSGLGFYDGTPNRCWYIHTVALEKVKEDVPVDKKPLDVGDKVTVLASYAESKDVIDGYACSTENYLKLIGQTGTIVKVESKFLIRFSNNINGYLHGADKNQWYIPREFVARVSKKKIAVGNTVEVKKSYKAIKYFTVNSTDFLDIIGKTAVVEYSEGKWIGIIIEGRMFKIHSKFLKVVM